MVGIKDMKKLVEFTKKAKAQLTLIGDTKQFKAIRAGDPFSMLQNSGMKTVKMSEVIRQKDEILKRAVKNLNSYNAQKAFEILDKNGKIQEIESINAYQRESFEDGVVERIVNDYLNSNENSTGVIISGKEELSTTLILTNTNKMKEKINAAIRDELKRKGKIYQEDFTFIIKESAKLNPTQKFFVQNFSIGQPIIFQNSPGIEYRVNSIDKEKNRLVLEDETGALKKIDFAKEAANILAYNEKEKGFSIGEKIVFEKNDKALGVNNGDVGIIKNIDRLGNITVLLENKKEINFNINEYNFFNHGYALTSYKSQGQTTNKVISYMDSSMQNFNSFYVTITRAVNDIKIYTDDKDQLKEMITHEQTKTNISDIKKLSLIDKLIKENRFQEAIKNIEKYAYNKKEHFLQKIFQKASTLKNEITNTSKQIFRAVENFLRSFDKPKNEHFITINKRTNDFTKDYSR